MSASTENWISFLSSIKWSNTTARVMDAHPARKDRLEQYGNPLILKSQVPVALGKVPVSAFILAWAMYQKYINGLPYTDRRKTGNVMEHRSAELRLATESSTVHKTIFSKCIITFIGRWWNTVLQWQMDSSPGIERGGRRLRFSRSYGCFEAMRMDYRQSSCMAVPWPWTAIHIKEFLEGYNQRISGNWRLSGGA